MSTPPPPPPGHNPPPFQQPGYQPPPGYQNYGQPHTGPQKNNGLSIAGFVLSLVNIIPCFWAFPLPAILGIIFGIIGKNQIAKDPSAKGRGLAIAALVIGVVFVIIAIIFWVYVTTSDNCYRDGSTFRCD